MDVSQKLPPLRDQPTLRELEKSRELNSQPYATK